MIEMEYILLAAVFIIVGGFAWHGYKRGLIRMVFSVVACFVAIGIASWLAPYTASFLRTQTPLYQVIKEKSIEAIQGRVEEIGQAPPPEEGLTIFGVEVPREMQELLFQNVAGAAGNWMKESGAVDRLAGQLAETVVQRVAWGVSFVLVGILMGILVRTLNIVSRLPVLKDLNRFGGFLLGLVQGLTIVWVFLLVIRFTQSSGWGGQVLEAVQKNEILSYLYQNNLIEQLVMFFLAS